MTQDTENDARESLHCIRCYRAITWPIAQVYPRSCLDCGLCGGYTANRPIPPALTAERAAGR